MCEECQPIKEELEALRRKLAWLNCMAQQIHRIKSGWEILWTDKHKGPSMVQGSPLEDCVRQANNR